VNETKSLTRGQWLTLAAAFLGWMFDGIEIGMTPLVARPALQDLLKMADESQVARWISVLMACFLLGAAIGGISFGWLGDKVGRVRGMVACMLMFSLFMGACYFVTMPWQFGLCLFLASLGMGGEWSLAVALVMECWPERHRPKLAGIIGAAANFGFLFVSLVALTWQVRVDDWRWMMLVGASPAVLALLIAFFVPESERWKAAAKQGGRSPIVEIFGPGLRKRTLLAMAFSAIPLIGTWAAVSGYLPTWAEQMQEAQVGKKMLPAASVAAFEAARTPKERTKVLNASLSPNHWDEVRLKAAHAKALVQTFLSIGAILGCMAASTLGGIYGRRPVYFALCLLSLLSCAYMFHFVSVYDIWFVIVGGVVGGITASFYGWLPLYLPELFPTRIRATGQGLSFNIGRVVAAGGTLCMGQFVGLFGNDYGRAMSVITLIYVIGLVLIWFAPETKGRPLPE
jgi:MFS transporter, SHS family, sialic acid transporter